MREGRLSLKDCLAVADATEYEDLRNGAQGYRVHARASGHGPRAAHHGRHQSG